MVLVTTSPGHLEFKLDHNEANTIKTGFKPDIIRKILLKQTLY